MMNKRGMDTRALNILLAVFILAIVIGGVYVWLGAKFAGAQKQPLSAAAGMARLDRELSEFVSAVPDLLDSSRESELEQRLSAWLEESFLDATVDCSHDDVLVCKLEITERENFEFVNSDYRFSVFLPIQNGIKEVRFSGTLQQ